jgi:RND family efflux transporter MFP subunit
MHDRNVTIDPGPKPALPRGGRWLQRLLPVVVLVLGGLLALWFVKTSPQTQPKPPQKSATLVEVAPPRIEARPAVIHSMGLVQAALRIALHPRVSGEIVSVADDFVPGGTFKKGDTLLKVDPTDYELAIRQLTRAVAEGEANLRVEEGSQAIAQKDFELLGQIVSEKDRDLVLRKPQLDMARAALESARAQLDKAELDLRRTTVLAPFNAVVQSRDVNIGARVGENTQLATLIGTDTYWVEATVPVNQLKWIRVAQNSAGDGSRVRVYNDAAWGPGIHREGEVVRLAADLEEQGRMARVYIAVEDPMSLAPENKEQPPLLIGSYVRTEIEGVTLENVAVLPRGLLRENDRVWVKSTSDTLEMRPVEVGFRGRDEVLVTSGLSAADEIVTTDIPGPVQGMALRTEAARPDGAGPGGDRKPSRSAK